VGGLRSLQEGAPWPTPDVETDGAKAPAAAADDEETDPKPAKKKKAKAAAGDDEVPVEDAEKPPKKVGRKQCMVRGCEGDSKLLWYDGVGEGKWCF